MKRVTIYTTDYCPFCRAAKELLNRKGIPFEEINVEDDDKKRAWLAQTTGQHTVPQIFVEDKSLGGFEELQRLEREGTLDKILGIS